MSGRRTLSSLFLLSQHMVNWLISVSVISVSVISVSIISVSVISVSAISVSVISVSAIEVAQVARLVLYRNVMLPSC